MSSKTPVSILQEFCTRNSLFPQYDLIVNGVGTHDPIFKYRLQCGNFISFGTGKSKKEAKHDAARDALSQMNSNRDNEIIIENDADMEDIADVVKDITLPYLDVLKENTIGALSALCSSNKLPEPEYILIGEEGPPHSKQFTFQCKVSHMVEQAMSRTKKQARHKSAKLMIEKLKVSFNNTLNFQSLEEDANNKESDDENDRVKEKYTDMQKKLKRPTENFGLKISDYHVVGKEDAFFVNNAGFNNLKENDISWLSKCEDPISILDEIIKDSEVDYVFSEVPLKKKSNVICVCLTLHTSPSWCTFGQGSTADEAKHNSSINMLRFLKDLIS